MSRSEELAVGTGGGFVGLYLDKDGVQLTIDVPETGTYATVTINQAAAHAIHGWLGWAITKGKWKQ
jgi:hypothetical protein